MNVSYDDENFTVSVATSGMWDLVSKALDYGIKSNTEQWQSVRNSTITGYDMAKKVLEEAGADLENVKISFDLVSDADAENVLVSAVDGSIFYDVIETMEKMAGAGLVETNPVEDDVLSESDKALVTLLESVAPKGYNNYAVDLKGGVVYVSYSYPGLTNVEAGLKAGGKDITDGWAGLVETTKGMQQSVDDLVKAYGADYPVTLTLLDDGDNSKELLVVTDGEVTYNIADHL